MVAGPSFSQEQQCRFQVRYEEGFDVACDPDYASWLRINHPDSPLLQHPTVPQNNASPSESVLRHFSSVIAVDSSPRNTESGTSKTPSTSSLSKFLIPPQVLTPTGRKIEPPRARLLTSSAAFEILKEKERRKQEEAEEKEKKKEREEAKKRKEEEQRKKAEERAKKQELKAKVRAEKKAKKGKEKQPAGVGTKRSEAPDQQNLPGQQLIPPLRLTTVNAVFVSLPMTTMDPERIG